MPEPLLATWFRHRGTFLLLATCPVVAWSLDARTAGVMGLVAGVALVGAGVVLRLLSVRRIGRGARVHRAHASAGLVADGPYARTRNPLYLAAACMLSGLGLVAGGGPYALLLAPLVLAVYAPVVRHEEEALRRLLGREYVEYLALVPRWVGLRRATSGRAATRVPWSEVFRREKLLVPGMLLALAGIPAVEHGLLPVAEWLDRLGQLLGLGGSGVGTLGVLVGAACNSALTERRRRRRTRSRGRTTDLGAGNLPLQH